MSKQQHTPGPWEYDEEQTAIVSLSPDIEAYEARVVDLVGAMGGSGDTPADARLIAAAPDLLAALEIATFTAEDMCEWLKVYAEPMQAERVRIVAEDCRAAIEKATGNR